MNGKFDTLNGPWTVYCFICTRATTAVVDTLAQREGCCTECASETRVAPGTIIAGVR